MTPWLPIYPPTEEEIERFCEENDVSRPDPNDPRACDLFASWLVAWVAEHRPLRGDIEW